MSEENGGSAFPTGGAQWDESERTYCVAPLEGGMTLRDYFAAKALDGWLATYGPDSPDPDPAYCAKFAYQMADAMLAEREKGGLT